MTTVCARCLNRLLPCKGPTENHFNKETGFRATSVLPAIYFQQVISGVLLSPESPTLCLIDCSWFPSKLFRVFPNVPKLNQMLRIIPVNLHLRSPSPYFPLLYNWSPRLDSLNPMFLDSSCQSVSELGSGITRGTRRAQKICSIQSQQPIKAFVIGTYPRLGGGTRKHIHSN